MPRTNHKWMVAACWCVPLCLTLHAASAAEPSGAVDPNASGQPTRGMSAPTGRSEPEGVVRLRGGALPARSTVQPVALAGGGEEPAGAGEAGCTARCGGPTAKCDARAGACRTPGNLGNGGCRSGAVSYPPIIRSATGALCPQCPSADAHVHPYLLTTRDVENQLKYYKWRTKAFLDAHADPTVEGGWFAAKCWLKDQWAMYLARNWIQSAALNAQLHAKLAYFVPSGCGGAGCPPIGFYSLVYPANPWHIDRRDTQIYANPTTGVPMVVPLPPNVEHVMHYSDDTPSSRLTRLGYRVYPR